MKIKFLLCTVFCLMGFLLCASSAYALDVPPEVQQYLGDSDMTAEDFTDVTLGQLLRYCVQAFTAQLTAPLRLFAKVCAFLLLAAVALNFAPSEGWKHTLELITVLCSFLLAAAAVTQLLQDVAQAVADWQTYLNGFIPVFAGVMVSCGQAGSALVYSSMFLSMAAFSAQVICRVAMPLLHVYLALNTSAGISGITPLQEASGALAKCVRGILTGGSFLFAGVLGLQSVLAQQSDSLAMRAGQFVLSSSIPVVGSAASDAMGSVLAGLKVVKGSLGFAAVLCAAFIPLMLRCVAYRLLLGAAGLVAKAFGLSRSGSVLEGVASGVGLCMAFLVFFFMLVVLSTALMIMTGNGG